MQRVDRSALKVNQAFISGLLILAFILSATPIGPALVILVAAVMAVGTVLPEAGLFKAVYSRILRPAGLVRPSIVEEDPAQHLFAQGMGAAVLFVALAAIGPLHTPVLAWALVWLVVALALVNLVFDFCAGCFLYTQLHIHRVLSPGARQ
jgi:hypothetical protein